MVKQRLKIEQGSDMEISGQSDKYVSFSIYLKKILIRNNKSVHVNRVLNLDM